MVKLNAKDKAALMSCGILILAAFCIAFALFIGVMAIASAIALSEYLFGGLI